METVADLLRAKKAEIELQLKGIATPAEEQGSISFGKRVGEGTSMAVDRLSLAGGVHAETLEGESQFLIRDGLVDRSEYPLDAPHLR